MKRSLILLACLIASGCGPSNYDDCILENMKGVSDKIAAVSVKNACRNKFKNNNAENYKYKNRELTYPEILKISISKPEYFVGSYIAKVHNENNCLHIANAVIEVSDGVSSETHKINVDLEPFSSSSTSIDIGGSGIGRDIFIKRVIQSEGYDIEGCKNIINNSSADDFFNQDFSRYGVK